MVYALPQGAATCLLRACLKEQKSTQKIQFSCFGAVFLKTAPKQESQACRADLAVNLNKTMDSYSVLAIGAGSAITFTSP
ncbi:hypothetical protein FHS90_000874 [Rufibacter quisquiliarum]|uniref:Uncharacterized protein n=1 Tax=Rufibacter quisquiliarum TaxID=1549639 RepID=A0A839GB64_9BACT|nr:hypothetical protein [Rufibacter quisquiliarum]